MGDFKFYFEIFAALMGFIYVSLEVLQKRFMWVMSLIASLAYIVVYAREGLYAMMLLQLYYICLAIYSYFKWGKSNKKVSGDQKMGYKVGKEDKDTVLVIRKMSSKVAIISIVLSILVFFIIGFIFSKYTDNPRPFLDAMVATLSMLATFWLSRKYIQQWYVWIVCNIISTYLYFSQAMYPTSILYSLYLIMAIYGIYHWRKKGVVLD